MFKNWSEKCGGHVRETGTAGLGLSSIVNPFDMLIKLTGDDVGLNVGLFVGNGVHLLGRNLQVPILSPS